MRRHLFPAAAVGVAVVGAITLLTPKPAVRPAPPPEPASPEQPAAPPEAPKDFRGVWAATSTDCAPGRETRLVVGARRLSFHESSGPILAVARPAQDEAAFTVELTGEGEVRRVEQRFRLGDGGRSLTALGPGGAEALVRRRCLDTPPDAA